MPGPVHHRLAIDRLLVPGRGVAGVPHLSAFLPEVGRIDRRPGSETDAVAGWGYKPTARRARRIAADRGLPYIALEDGFLRSIGLGEAGAPPLSLVADDLGIYYDARGPSRIERLIQDQGWLTPEIRARAEAAIGRIVQGGLGKTNAAPRLPKGVLPPTERMRILVVDQTLGDASIAGALAENFNFGAMIAHARNSFPDEEIVVRRHPAVAAGLKQGCIDLEAMAGTTVLDIDCRAADILERVDFVYTVSSLLGFEALLHGKKVSCFGMPFYGGWGATHDAIHADRRTATHDAIRNQRRTAKRGVTEIFAAAYLGYARYVDPITGEPTTLEATIERLLGWRDLADENAGHFAAIGFTPWKRAAVRNALAGPRARVSFHRDAESAERAAAADDGRLLVWSGKEDAAMRRQLDSAAAPVWRMEDGFLRSRGLGSDFHLPASIVLDDQGIYFDRHAPSRLETILETADLPPELTARAAKLRARLVASGISKYNIGGAAAFDPPSGKEVLLVVGQVEDDRSIERGTADIATNLELLRVARADRPDAWLVYKPHPDVETGNRKGAVADADLAALADHVARDADIAICLAAADTLATMTSLAGFEALLRGKRVVTYGGPFYAGWGLTEDRLDFPRRSRRLTLDQLVAGTLVLYPRYIHPPTGLPCTPEEIVDWLESAAPAPGNKRWRWLRALWASVSGKPPVHY